MSADGRWRWGIASISATAEDIAKNNGEGDEMVGHPRAGFWHATHILLFSYVLTASPERETTLNQLNNCNHYARVILLSFTVFLVQRSPARLRRGQRLITE